MSYMDVLVFSFADVYFLTSAPFPHCLEKRWGGKREKRKRHGEEEKGKRKKKEKEKKNEKEKKKKKKKKKMENREK